MSSPEPPPREERPPVEQAAYEAEMAAVEQDGASLLLSLLAVLVAYKALAGAARIKLMPVEVVARSLGISAKMSRSLLAVARRALSRMGSDYSPDEVEELLATETAAAQAAVDTAVQQIAQAFQALSDNDTEPGETEMQRLADSTAVLVRNAAQAEAARLADWTRKSWIDMGDDRVRPSHAFLGSPLYEYHIVRLEDPFITITGAELMFPGDRTAPIEEWIGCRCRCKYYKITGPISQDDPKVRYRVPTEAQNRAQERSRERERAS